MPGLSTGRWLGRGRQNYALQKTLQPPRPDTLLLVTAAAIVGGGGGDNHLVPWRQPKTEHVMLRAP